MTEPNVERDRDLPADVPVGIGYADAVAELEQLLTQLEQDDVDIDVLATQVRRAAELIRLCRDRIAGARFDVEQIVADLSTVIPPAGATGDADEADDDEADEAGEDGADETAGADDRDDD